MAESAPAVSLIVSRHLELGEVMYQAQRGFAAGQRLV
jgi:hypothetical protein